MQLLDVPIINYVRNYDHKQVKMSTHILEREQIKNIIRNHFPILYQEELVEELARESTLVEFKAGDTILDYGEFVRSVPLVYKGSIKVVRQDPEGNELFLYYLLSGESCAASFSCCLMQKRSEIKTIAEEDACIIAIPLLAADTWMGKYPVWRNFVLRMYDQRIYDLIDTIDRIAFSNMAQQLMDYLHEKARVTGSSSLSITHQDIANDLHASREAVSRLLKKMEKEELLSLGRNRIELNR